jgi:hypothetical protein
MAETYTYTARNADKPDEVLTFTLRGDHLYVDIAGVLEQIEKVREAEQIKEEVHRQMKAQAKPVMLKVIESFSGPVHVSDAKAYMVGDGLVVNVWRRVAGFRLAPMLISISRVDNPEATNAFITELDERKKTAGHVGKFFGPLDYWFGWAGLLVLFVILVRWPHRDK